MFKLAAIITLSIFISCNATNTSNKAEQQTAMDRNNNNQDWIKTTNIYEVNLRQYTKEGTFNAFATHLPRLKEMGVKTLWFMPITPIAQKEKKGVMGSYYAASDYTSINPEFGTLDDFKNLVTAAHEQGFKVIIDWVANHTGWDHKWTKEHPDWYLKDSATNDFKKASGMDDIIELDYKNPQLRKAMIDAMRFWVKETGIDGYRCDLAFWVKVDFWIEAKKALADEKPLFWLGELDALDNPEYMQVFDAAYSWTWMHKTEEFYKQHLPLTTLDSVLTRYQAAPGITAWFTANHDENSWNGTEYEKYGDAAKALAVFSCTWPGIPLVYSGQELPNKKRLKFFEKDVIEWKGTNELQDFYKTLFALRDSNAALIADKGANTYRLHTSEDASIFAYLRKNGDKEVLVLLNLSPNKLRFDLPDNRVNGQYKNVFSKAANDFTRERSFEMQPWE
ncbi:MAG TPA: alpha-amylase family glycosyl hydrolase, partial [Chitinophagaceae bacterium]|nr:alpha-amylase family glycosyl hydrolase [Chitinophagaceae bacterium]